MDKYDNFDKFCEFLNGYNNYPVYSDYVDKDIFDEDYTADDLYEAIIEDNGFDEEIIYFSNAMKYLSENDPSLRESLELAYDFGYETKDLNSEILASLLASEYNRKYFPKTDIQDFLDSLDWSDYENTEDCQLPTS